MGRELSSANELLSGKRASQWEKSFLVGRPRELPSGKRASQWEAFACPNEALPLYQLPGFSGENSKVDQGVRYTGVYFTSRF